MTHCLKQARDENEDKDHSREIEMKTQKAIAKWIPRAATKVVAAWGDQKAASTLWPTAYIPFMSRGEPNGSLRHTTRVQFSLYPQQNKGLWTDDGVS